MSLFTLFEDSRGDEPFTVLTVCTGNICRSPLAESLLRMVLRGLPVHVHSAGTGALVGEPMSEQNRFIAAELGVPDADAHRARQLVPEHVRDSDLVFALSREHRRAIVELVPRASRRVFTLREFARLAEATELSELTPSPDDRVEQRLRDAVDLIAAMRGTIPPPADPADEDVIDPYRQPDEVYARSARQLVPGVNSAARLLWSAAQGRPS